MTKFWLILGAILFVFPAFGQVALKGKIIADSLQGSEIHIINTTRQSGTVNSTSGGFEISVEENDTLLFSSIQYEKLEIRITKKILQENYLEVVLAEGVQELGEVNISNISLTGNIEQDVSSLPVVNKFNLGIPLNKKPLPTPEERRLFTAANGPVDIIVNTLSGRIKQLKKEKKVSDLVALVNRAEKSISPGFFTQELGLQENEVTNFIYYCAENSDLNSMVAGSDELHLREYFIAMNERYFNFINE